MYITTGTAILLFLILMAVLDNNKKEGEPTFFEDLNLAFYMLLGLFVILIYLLFLGLIYIGIPALIIYSIFYSPPEIQGIIKGPLDWLFSHPFIFLCLLILGILIAPYEENTETRKKGEEEIEKEKPLWSVKKADNMMKFFNFSLVIIFLILLALLTYSNYFT